jgi:hypothetical protein
MVRYQILPLSFKDILANGLGIGAFLICRTVLETEGGGQMAEDRGEWAVGRKA